MVYNPKPTDPLNLVYCDVGEETYALDMTWVRSVQRIDRMLTNAEMRPDDAGFVGWLPSNRGDIPVFTLAHRLGRSAASNGTGAQQRIIVLPSPAPYTNSRDEEGQPWGLLVDRVSQVVQSTADHFAPLPAIATDPTTNYFEGVIKANATLTLFLSPEWLHPNAPLNPDGPKRPAGQPQEPSKPRLKVTKSVGPTLRTGRLLTFSLMIPQPLERPLSFGLSIAQVTEILRMPSLIPIPTALPYILGLLNWRDHVVPVIDLTSRLTGDRPTNGSTGDQAHLVVIRGTEPDTYVAFPVQSNLRLLRLPLAHQVSTRTFSLNQDFIQGTFELKQETLAILNIAKILWLEW